MAANIFGPCDPKANSLFTYLVVAAEQNFSPPQDEDDDCECDELESAKKKLAEAEAKLAEVKAVDSDLAHVFGPERLQPLAVLQRVHRTLMEHTGNINKTVLQDMLDDVEDCLHWQGRR